MDRAAALALLTAQCAAAVYPLMSATELGALLDATTGFTVWTPGTAYVYGQVVQPTVRIGHLYRVIVAGTSGPTEPDWPPYTSPDNRIGVTRPFWHNAPAVYTSGLVQDQDIVWEEAGADSATAYDVRTATYQAWLAKAGKATADYTVAIDRDKYERGQVAQNCLMMAQRYAPLGIF